MGNFFSKKRKRQYSAFPLQSINVDESEISPTNQPPNYLSILHNDHDGTFIMKFGPLTYKYKVDEKSLKCVPQIINTFETITIGTWNMQDMDESKISNPGVLETVCLLILRRRIDVLTLQEIGSENVVAKICNELNSPTFPKIRAFFTVNKQIGQRFHYSYVCEPIGRMYRGKEYSAVIYINRMIRFLASSPLKFRQGKRPMVRYPFLTIFELNSHFRFVLISVHLKPNEAKNETLKVVYAARQIKNTFLKRYNCGEHLIVAGDFNLSPNNGEFTDFYSIGLKHCFDEYTNISVAYPRGTACYDNVWTGLTVIESTIVRDGLTHPFIPYNCTWGGTVSDHCPLIVTLKIS